MHSYCRKGGIKQTNIKPSSYRIDENMHLIRIEVWKWKKVCRIFEEANGREGQ